MSKRKESSKENSDLLGIESFLINMSVVLKVKTSMEEVSNNPTSVIKVELSFVMLILVTSSSSIRLALQLLKLCSPCLLLRGSVSRLESPLKGTTQIMVYIQQKNLQASFRKMDKLSDLVVLVHIIRMDQQKMPLRTSPEKQESSCFMQLLDGQASLTKPFGP